MNPSAQGCPGMPGPGYGYSVTIASTVLIRAAPKRSRSTPCLHRVASVSERRFRP
jgi:hypothetical protein